MIVKPTHAVIKPGPNIGKTSFDVSLDTVDSAATTLLDVNTKQLEVTGTYGFWPSPSFWGNIGSAIWQTIVSFGGRMDVVIGITDKIAISVNNPTFGYPYTVFVDSDNGRGGDRHNYYEHEEHTYVDSVGRKYSCTRNTDSDNKEFIIVVCV
jgi:hypothetical protein